MFSLGWMEISIILIITVIVVGPKEIPTVIRFVKSITSNLKKLSKEFTSTVDEITHLQEVKDIKKEILDTKEAVVKEGKDLDEFIDKSNKEILDQENKNV
jgi:sec-independent protein translocase protein TatB